MELIDLSTLVRVNLALNLMAALVWLLLGEVFRMAPRASRLMAAVHALRLLPLGVELLESPAPGLLLALNEICWLASSALLLLAVRRMLRSPYRSRDVSWLAGLGTLAIALAELLGSPALVLLLGGLAVIWLSLRTVHDLLAGIGQAIAPALQAIMALPFVGIAALVVARIVALAVADGALPAIPRMAAELTLTLSITLTLMALLIWRLITRIQHLMLSDPLTGAISRRGFEEELARAHAQLRRGHAYAVAMVDLDHFKRLNDLHGHAAGDAALQHCVQVLKSTLREYDRLGRVGGEEFALLLPDADVDGARRAAERLRRQLESAPLHWGGQTLALTASFGVALAQADDPDAQAALLRADAELYIAKAGGRNRVSAPAREARA
ncbi:MAG: hypothetical protein DI603_09665 [Roseateles depolymerans]|uniref:diguanylate cyclase n=1 Tax=Roseateles depolymerans TaxID=76731 RepID=A0A2W5FPK4_9BURK|nr:MAG: hypothetical protein DI603_09665 [Roseateles depolymerans]